MRQFDLPVRNPQASHGSLQGAFGLVCLTLVAFLVINGPLFAQERNPLAGDAKAIKLGEFQFRSNCAFCHGLGARGGGPDASAKAPR